MMTTMSVLTPMLAVLTVDGASLAAVDLKLLVSGAVFAFATFGAETGAFFRGGGGKGRRGG